MSRTIDQRVVEMQFDNQHFERNVATTMSTVDKLKQSLNFSGVTKGFGEIDSAAKGVNMSGLSNAVDVVREKFSALEVMGVTALANLTNSAVNAGKRMVSALTIDPIKTGFQEYETQIGAVQTILANTKSKGSTLDDVNDALEQLNEYADQTIYNFTEMTRNIGTFTAAGVDLETSVSSIKGIANLAAISGSTSQQASTAMYQLSQALAAGKVSLMDWNSVVNAGMGGEVFQNALKRTAENLGTNVDAMIEKYGSFRESLTKGEWLTAEVLTETLTQLSGAYTEADLIAKGYSQQQAKEILELAGTAESAATDVKTFTQLWDTLKESAQSGWSQTWKLIVGDFEEAKATLSEVSKVIGGLIEESAGARNELIKGWKEAGGRTDLIDSFRNAFQGVMNIVTPIREAFRDIFPATTVEQLVTFTGAVKNLTAKFLEFTETYSGDIKSTFTGIFSLLDIGWTFIKDLAGGIKDLISNFSGLSGNVLEITGSFGEWLSGLRDTIKETDYFGAAVDKIVEFLSNAITKIKEFGSSVKGAFQTKDYEGFSSFFSGLWDIIKNIGAKIGDIFSALGTGLNDALSGDTNFFNILNTGLFAGILAGIQKFVWSLSDPFGEDGLGGLFDNVKGVLDDVRGCFEAYQNQLNAGTLLKIASAIGVLAAAIFVIAKIDPNALDQALGAIGVLFAELLASFGIFSKISTDITGVTKACAAMISISTSVLILASAMSKLGELDWEQIAKGLVGVGALMAEISLFLATAKIDGKMMGTATGIVVLSSAILILANAVKDFGEMNWGEIIKGLTAVGVLLAELTIFTNVSGNAQHVVSTGAAMVLLGASMKIFASAIADFGSMSLTEIGKGLLAMGGALAEVALAMKMMPTNTLAIGAGLVVAGASLKIIADAMSDFGGMEWSEIGKGLVGIGAALAELAIALNAMNGTLAGSAALIVAAGALAIIAPVMKSLGEMTWGEIAKGLITIAGAFTVVGVAGALLTPLVPTIAGLAGSFALFGLSIVGIGAGVALLGAGLSALAAGLTALAVAGTAGATAVVAALSIIVTGIADLIPTVVSKLGEAILAFCDVVVECAPAIAETLLVLVTEVMAALAKYTPEIVSYLMDFFIDVLDAFAEKLPELIVAAVDVIGAFFEGIVEALRGIDTSSLIEGIVGVGFLSALMLALSAIVSLIPGAMAGVLGMGVVIAELAVVLAAIGALAQIPGLQWLIEQGGDFLQSIGTAIGQFIGGIAGGFAEGVSSALPQIGSDLTAFMTNAQGFIDGAKSLDPSMLEGVRMLAETVLILTAAEVLDGLTSWITGGSSLRSFGEDLGALGTNLSEFATNLGTFGDGQVQSITCAANAVKAMAEAAEALPNEGGWLAKLVGDNNIATFGGYLPELGSNLATFAANLGTFGEDKVATVTCAANAVKAIAEASEDLPNEGGWLNKIFGDNSIGAFSKNFDELGKNLASFVANLGTFGEDNVATVDSAVRAVKALADLADADLGAAKKHIEGFGNKLGEFGADLAEFCGHLSGTTSVTTAVSNVEKILGAVDKIAKANSDALVKFADSLNTVGEEGVDSFVEAFTSSSAKKDVEKAAADLANKAVDGMKTKSKSITTTATDMVENAATQVKGKYQSFYTTGAYLGEGLALGIASKVQRVANQAASMVTAAVNAAKAAAGIASPSKVFYRLGEFTGMGFVNALGDYCSKSYDAAYEMADSARSGLSDTIGRIANVLDGEINIQPTIRPVLDLSDVRSGAGTISSLLNANRSIGVLANVGAISAQMNGNGQNRSNADVVSAINKLRGDLGNLGTTQYNINGITYDDGSNIADAVKTIARRVKIERRV